MLGRIDVRHGSTNEIQMTTPPNRLTAAVAALVLSCLMASAGPALAGTLTGVSATASSTAPGATGVTYTLKYTTATALSGADGDNLFHGSFPSTFSLPPCGAAAPVSCNGFLTVSINGVPQNVATFTQGYFTNTFGNGLQVKLASSASVAANSNVVIAISGNTNPTPFDTSPFITFRSIANGGTPIDEASPLPSFTAAIAPQPVPTMTEWAMILLGLTLAGGAAVAITRRRIAA